MYAQSTVLSSLHNVPAAAGFNQKPGSRFELPGRYGFRVILRADYSGRRHIHAEDPAIEHAREISIRHRVLFTDSFLTENMSAPPFC